MWTVKQTQNAADCQNLRGADCSLQERTSQQCGLLLLPTEILLFLADYFHTETKYRNKLIFPFQFDWRNFMNTNSKYLGKWKRKSQLLQLYDEHSKQFLTSTFFRKRILLSVENPRDQLQLMFQTLDTVKEDAFYKLQNLNTVYLEGTSFPSDCYFDVEEILLVGCKINFLLCFSPAVRRVTLDTISPLSEEKALDLSTFQYLQEFALDNDDNITNYHCLDKIMKLSISRCDSITDVSCFKGVTYLDLSNCKNIIDVSSLANVTELNLTECNGITDVSSLGRVHKLNLSSCKNIRDVSALGNVHTLNLNHCLRVTDVSGLHSVYSLSLRSFQGVDISGLKNVVILDLSFSLSVSDISPLENVRVLNLEGCMKVIGDFTRLLKLKELMVLGNFVVQFGVDNLRRQLTKLDLDLPHRIIIEPPNRTVSSFEFIQNLTGLKSLCLHSTQSITTIPLTLSHLQTVVLHDLQQLTTVPSIPSLGKLGIYSCSNLTTLEIPAGDVPFPLYELTIGYCELLKELSVCRKTARMKVISCDSLQTLKIFQQVGSLKIDSCPNVTIVGESNVVFLSVMYAVSEL
jgi:hypothetical protein